MSAFWCVLVYWFCEIKLIFCGLASQCRHMGLHSATSVPRRRAQACPSPFNVVTFCGVMADPCLHSSRTSSRSLPIYLVQHTFDNYPPVMPHPSDPYRSFRPSTLVSSNETHAACSVLCELYIRGAAPHGRSTHPQPRLIGHWYIWYPT